MKIYAITISAILIISSCGGNESNKEIARLKSENNSLNKKLNSEKETKDREITDNEIKEVMNSARTLFLSIQNKDYQTLSSLCCNECDTDTESLNLCNMESMKWGERIGVRNLYKNAQVLSATVNGVKANVKVYIPSSKYKGDLSFEKKNSKWLLVSL